jgi:hypothetical protein
MSNIYTRHSCNQISITNSIVKNSITDETISGDETK